MTHCPAIRGTAPRVLIIDPWALLVPHAQQLLQHINDSHSPWVQAVIAWDSADEDNRKCDGQLRALLEATFSRKLAEAASISLMAARGIPTMEDFGDLFGSIVEASVRKYLGSAEAYPPVGRTVERPRSAELARSASICGRKPRKRVRKLFKRTEMSEIRPTFDVYARDSFGKPADVRAELRYE